MADGTPSASHLRSRIVVGDSRSTIGYRADDERVSEKGERESIGTCRNGCAVFLRPRSQKHGKISKMCIP